MSLDKRYVLSYYEDVKYLEWNAEKNTQLRAEREMGFEEITVAINDGKILGIIKNPNQKKYPGQRIFIIEIDNYAYMVPFVEDEQKIFLKTIVPSRKATRDYIINKKK